MQCGSVLDGFGDVLQRQLTIAQFVMVLSQQHLRP
jgi:hypothetical protein